LIHLSHPGAICSLLDERARLVSIVSPDRQRFLTLESSVKIGLLLSFDELGALAIGELLSAILTQYTVDNAVYANRIIPLFRSTPTAMHFSFAHGIVISIALPKINLLS
jgi:hypothetical protein